MWSAMGLFAVYGAVWTFVFGGAMYRIERNAARLMGRDDGNMLERFS